MFRQKLRYFIIVLSIRSAHEPGGLEATGCRKDEQVRLLDSQPQEFKADAVTMVSQWDG